MTSTRRLIIPFMVTASLLIAWMYAGTAGPKCYRCGEFLCVGPVTHLRHPTCVNVHTTPVVFSKESRDMKGVSVRILCERCFSKLSPQGRIPYYKALWNRKMEEYTTAFHEEATWEDVERAVLEGV